MMAVALPALLILPLAALSLSWGDAGLAPGDVAAWLSGDPVAAVLVGSLRAPRLAAALLVGACLGVAGAITQAVMRNPLAEPGLLGINGGAGFAVMLLIVHPTAPTGQWLPVAGFAGAAVAAGAIYALSWNGGTSSIRLILIGIGVSALTGAGIAFITAFGEVSAVQRAMSWMAGSLYGSDWTRVSVLLAWAVPALAATCLLSRELGLMAFDDDTLRGLGLRLQLMRGMMILLCTLLAGAAVAMAGPIAFIGLIAPHLARLSAKPRYLIPITALYGAMLLLAADIMARALMLPAGILAPLIGAPFVGFLLRKQTHE
ncbi:iron ABC transporter permease [Ancylobacter sp. A5.8]|uniref:FecCD family ABC transporter permease n=1 Tax=Ancylobacter gelatini TaxID=2919920 RepID=UPI001F4E7962|nr:iron ABC transporter permease [Ancylobacter gelatini]MCJ8144081.1 iron ABC transporter permease [Ancylobacter gelatini]